MEMNAWTWGIAALILAALETMYPGAFMIWIGIAAGFTAILTWMLSLGWEMQILCFAILSVLSIAYGHRWYRNRRKVEPDSNVNQRINRMTGKVYPLLEATEQGRSHIQIGDSPWAVVLRDWDGENELEKGHKVRIEVVKGSVLHVDRVDD